MSKWRVVPLKTIFLRKARSKEEYRSNSRSLLWLYGKAQWGKWNIKMKEYIFIITLLNWSIEIIWKFITFILFENITTSKFIKLLLKDLNITGRGILDSTTLKRHFFSFEWHFMFFYHYQFIIHHLLNWNLK